MGMSVMEPKAKEKYLNQVLDFVNADLEALPFSEKVAWAARFHIQRYAFIVAGLAGKDFGKKFDYEQKIKKLSPLQEILRKHIDWLTTAKAGEVLSMVPMRRLLRIGEDYSVQYDLLPDEGLFVIGRQRGETEEDTHNLLVMLQFDDALDGLPRNAIKKCPECGNFFAHLSRKEKDYCSPKCAYKFLSRKRREELKKHPKRYKAYLKKQRESMRKVYEKNQKGKGSNVVVQRNGKE